MSPSELFGQGTHEREDFVRNNCRTISAGTAEASYSGEELRRLHPTNLLKAIQLIDPSVCGTDPDEKYGADPNAAAASMSLQGTKSLPWKMSSTDALPLIIVDGHAESIDRLQDFDILRVENVTLLKNATATAIYGVRA